MPNVLTPLEAATVLRCAEDDPDMLELLPLIDEHLEQATGRDWTSMIEGEIDKTAKSAARMLLVMWHEDPAMSGSENPLSQFGLPALMIQLKAKALKLEEEGL